ncbi:MAG: O-antigen ligase family protein [Bacteroidales bacterium]|nr:O-antigen ligase family protein [Bacteroidales bacterium]
MKSNTIKDLLTPFHLYLFGIAVISIGIPTSNFLMSIAQMIMLTAWVWDGKLKSKLTSFTRNKAALVAVSIFALHVLWLVNTTDFVYAVKDLRTKIPLLILPLVFSTMPTLSRKQMLFFIGLFSASVLFSSIYSIYVLINEHITDHRNMSVFISHIRFSLSVCLAAFLMAYTYTQHSLKLWLRILAAITAIWFTVFLFILGAMTGIIVLFSSIVILMLIYIFRKTTAKYRVAFILILIGLPTALFFYTRNIVIELTTPVIINFSELEKETPHGHWYIHDTIHFGRENGKWIGLYFCPEELPEAWSKQSELDYFGLDEKGQALQSTLVRYLNSKGLKKDAEGVAQLSKEDVRFIESGVANINYVRGNPIKKAICQFLFGYEIYQNNKDPRGSTMMQRFELWHASTNIISKNFLTGVGTGDLPIMFKTELNHMGSTLCHTSLRSHNQFLSIFVGFGLFGFIWFLFALFYPGFKLKKFKFFPFLIFFLIFMISLLNEDTIESQAGVTFFAFFNAFFLFACNFSTDDTNNKSSALSQS